MSDAVVTALRRRLGADAVETGPAALTPHLVDWRGWYRGAARCRVRPRTAGEVAETVAVCAETGTPVVPQGGETGLAGGGVPGTDGTAVLLATDRLTRVREVDPANNTITVEAGCILQDIQDTAAAHDRLFPVSLAAEGSCRIGGNLATNAGGLNALAHGTMRQQVLGLEAVTADGRLWDGLRRVRKEVAGYDLKQLFIGAEGTLGVMTAAVLRLYPRPRESASAFAGVPSVEAALALLTRVQAATGNAATAFELLPDRGIRFAERHEPGAHTPLTTRPPWAVWIEVAGGTGNGQLRAGLEDSLAAAHADGEVADAVVARDEGQAGAFRRLRDAVVGAQRHEGASIKHDIAVPVSAVPDFLAAALPAVAHAIPGVRPVPFGHLGDGNLHFNLTQPRGMDRDTFMAHWDTVTAMVHDIVHAQGGTVSAEHGIGQLKRGELARFQSATERAMQRAIKDALDPQHIMNPGKVLP